jgi:probable rRNA maturation factor
MIEPEINVSIKRNIGLPVDKSWLENMVGKVLQAERITSSAEMGLLITDSQTVQKLNRIYRDEDQPTDVLAFQMTPDKNQEPEARFIGPPDGIKHLGEVVISYPQAAKQAQECGRDVMQELALLIVHGVLHLLGYDHETLEDEKKMRDRESEILSSLDLS